MRWLHRERTLTFDVFPLAANTDKLEKTDILCVGRKGLEGKGAGGRDWELRIQIASRVYSKDIIKMQLILVGYFPYGMFDCENCYHFP